MIKLDHDSRLLDLVHAGQGFPWGDLYPIEEYDFDGSAYVGEVSLAESMRE